METDRITMRPFRRALLEVRVRGFSDALDTLDNDDWQEGLVT